MLSIRYTACLYPNNPKTPESILKISSMMRYITDESEVMKTPLKSELKFIENYIEIEQLRFGHEANIQYAVKGKIEGVMVEPLLLITLVENAFKHGLLYQSSEFFCGHRCDYRRGVVGFYRIK